MGDPTSDFVDAISASLKLYENEDFIKKLDDVGCVIISSGIDGITVTFTAKKALWEILECSSCYGYLRRDAVWVADQLLKGGWTAEKYVATIESRTGFRVPDY